MEWKKYKLGEIAEITSSKRIFEKEYVDDGVPFIRGQEISDGSIADSSSRYKCYISEKRYDELKSTFGVPQRNDILMTAVGTIGNIYLVEDNRKFYFKDGNIIWFKNINAAIDSRYLTYFMQSSLFKKQINHALIGAVQKALTIVMLSNVEIKVPSLLVQKKIAAVLSNLDRKIALNKRINHNLEAMAKQLYDYWFVQFDFPNAEGKPYKSSGGKMVWNEELKRNIPQDWNICMLSDYIDKNNTGDWGYDESSESHNLEVGCIRGADIIKLNKLPRRFIKNSNEHKLLSPWDIVIEVSGGSPVQATGRSALITDGVIARNGGKLTCSNFCHAFTLKDIHNSTLFYYMWNMFYENGIMFNYEGKTSGIKNFMTDTFLANKWVDVPSSLAERFFVTTKMLYEIIDSNVAENNLLEQQRDELLPLLMNGQATVNSD